MVQVSYIFSQNERNALTPPPSVMNPPPQAHFSWSNGCLGDTTCFINQSILANTYTWTIAEDSATQHGGHVIKTLYKSFNDSILCYYFNKAGNYSVTLTCYDNHWDSITQIISIDTISKLSFYYVGCRDVFVNQSTCASSFLWNFGDGHTSTATSPIYEYGDTGHYNVTLIGYNGNKSDTLTKQIHISTVGFINPNFTHTILGDTVFVHAIDSAYGVTFYWTWSDGTFSSGQNTFHVFKDSTALYNINLVAINTCGPGFKGDTIYIIHNTIIPDSPPGGLDFSNSILTIVPNPIENSNYIDAFFNSYTDNVYLAQVYNALGQKMFEENFAFQAGINEFKISTANLSTGVYLLALQAGNSYIRKKFYIINQ